MAKVHIHNNNRPLCGTSVIGITSVHLKYWEEKFNPEDFCSRCKKIAIERKQRRQRNLHSSGG